MSQQVRTTLIFGFISALFAALLIPLPIPYLSWSTAAKLYMLGVLTLYSILLCRWSETALIKILFPVVLVSGMMLIPTYFTGYGCVALLIFAWIRSGICFTGTPLRAILAEILILGGFVSLMAVVIPYSGYGLPVAMWLFFLMQALYFYLVPQSVPNCHNPRSEDSFEHAFREMEKLFSSGVVR